MNGSSMTHVFGHTILLYVYMYALAEKVNKEKQRSAVTYARKSQINPYQQI